MTDIRILQENVRRNMKKPEAWVELADALEAIGEHDKAKYCRERAIKLLPTPSREQTAKFSSIPIEKDVDEKLPEESHNNRTFMILVGILGGLILVSIVCLGTVYFFYSRNTTAAQQAQAENATQTAVASNYYIGQALTSTFEAVVLQTVTYFPTQTLFSTPSPSTPNITMTMQAAFSEIDVQFQSKLRSNIAFNKPEQMDKNQTTTIEFILNPSLSAPILATQIAVQGGFVTSTAEPDVLIAPNGETVTIITSQIEITPRMKAVLLPQDPEAFMVTEMHDNAEQVVSSVDTTAWRWSVTAKKEGSQTLELVIYQLVKYDGKEFWHEVETYKANIVVEVTMGDRIRAMDWYWIAGFIVTLGGVIFGVWKWLDERKKKPGVMKVEIVEKKSPPKRKK